MTVTCHLVLHIDWNSEILIKHAQTIVNNGASVYAIVRDLLTALELAITPDMGHDGWASDVTLSNIHERSLFTSHFHLYKNTKVSMETPKECIWDLLQN